MKTLLIDDIRNLSACFTARNYAEGLRALKREKWDHLLLDHDLGSFNESGKEFTGYDIACWLERNPEYLPKRVTVVSSNPVGVSKIKSALKRLTLVF